MAEFKVYIKNVKISPKKLRFLVTEMKKQSPVEAVHTLMYTQKKGAVFLRKAISSALSNAKNTMNIEEGLLQFKSVAIEEGLRLKRFRAGSKGMAKPIRHEYAHIKLVLESKDSADTKVVKADVKPVELEAQNVEPKKEITKNETKISAKRSKLQATSSK